MSARAPTTARGAYRVLLRAQQKLFRGDIVALTSAREQTRAEFQKQAGETDPDRVAMLVADAVDTAQFMRSNVVQAQLNERGNYEMSVDPELHTTTGDKPEYVEDVHEAADLYAMKEKRPSPPGTGQGGSDDTTK